MPGPRALALALALASLVLLGAAATAQTKAEADVSVEAIETIPWDPGRGEHVTVSVVLANQHEEPANGTRVEIIVDGNQTLDTDRFWVDVPPERTVTVTAEWQSVEPGQHTIHANASTREYDQNPSDNELEETVTVDEEPPIDERVRLQPAQRTVEVEDAGWTPVNWTLENLRDRPNRVQVSTEDEPANVSMKLLGYHDLDAGDQRTLEANISVHGNLTPGANATFQIVARDDGNATSIAEVRLEVVGSMEDDEPDLGFNRDPMPDEADDGTYVEAWIHNHGGPADAFDVEIGIGNRSQTVRVDGLASFQDTEIRAGPFEDPNGTVWGHIDPDGEVDEADATNNRAEGARYQTLDGTERNEPRSHGFDASGFSPGAIHHILLMHSELVDPGGEAVHRINITMGNTSEPATFDLAIGDTEPNWSARLTRDEVTVPASQDGRPGLASVNVTVSAPEDPDPVWTVVPLEATPREGGEARTYSLLTSTTTNPSGTSWMGIHPEPSRIDVETGNRSATLTLSAPFVATEQPAPIVVQSAPEGWTVELDVENVTFPGDQEVGITVEAPANATENGTIQLAVKDPDDGETFETVNVTTTATTSARPSPAGEEDEDGDGQALEEQDASTPAAQPVGVQAMSAAELALAAAAGASALLAGLAAFVERVRYRLWTFLLPLYTRLGREDVLDNELRSRILDAIQEDPGVHYSGLQRSLDLNAGALTYHLQVLQREGFVESQAKGRRKLFFPTGEKPGGPVTFLPDPRRRVLDAICDNPGASQTAIARELDVSRQLVHHHVHELAEEGLVRIDEEGRSSQLFPER